MTEDTKRNPIDDLMPPENEMYFRGFTDGFRAALMRAKSELALTKLEVEFECCAIRGEVERMRRMLDS